MTDQPGEFDNDVCECEHYRYQHMQIPEDTHCLTCIIALRAEDHCNEFRLKQRKAKPRLVKPERTRGHLRLIKNDPEE